MTGHPSTHRALHTIREAHEAVGRLASIDAVLWEKAQALLQNRRGKIIVTGVGKSGYIAMKMAATLTSLGHVALFVHPIEALHGDSGAVSDGDVMIAFSFSGNTKELMLFVRHVAKHFDVPVIGVTGGMDSLLAHASTVSLPISIREEGCPLNLAPMASTSAMLVLADAFASLITSPDSFQKSDFARFHPSGTLGLTLTKVEERVTLRDDIHVRETDSLSVTLARMTFLGKGIVGVVSHSGELVGSVTDGDVRRFFEKNISGEGANARALMSSEPKYVSRRDTMKDALTLMEAHKITNLFVVDDARAPIGIIHIHDIIAI